MKKKKIKPVIDGILYAVFLWIVADYILSICLNVDLLSTILIVCGIFSCISINVFLYDKVNKKICLNFLISFGTFLLTILLLGRITYPRLLLSRWFPSFPDRVGYENGDGMLFVFMIGGCLAIRISVQVIFFVIWCIKNKIQSKKASNIIR